MLVDVVPDNTDSLSNAVVSVIAELNGNMSGYRRLYRGVYEIGHFSFDHILGRNAIKDHYPEFEPALHKGRKYPRSPHNPDAGLIRLGSYGVCDSVDQLLETYSFDNDPRKLVISLTKVSKANQSPDGGWRWHKWGEYIGTFTPCCEYLYDEVGIEEVYVYHIYELN